ncbi:MAG: phenylpyruvate tautomerase MIF-related protein, partial [Gammaproteobacteria bacterium]
MPYLKLQTNTGVNPAQTGALLKKLSKTVAQHLGKPESYVMVALEPPAPMLFAG